MKSVVVTGMGAVSALGLGVSAQWQGLSKAESGIQSTEWLGQQLYLGKVALSDEELARAAKISYSKYTSRTALLGLLAAREALVVEEGESLCDTALIMGTTVGGMLASEKYFLNHQGLESVDFSCFAQHDLGSNTDFIARSLSEFGYVNTISTACSSGANAIMLGAQMIASGAFERVLVGGADALCTFTIEGFKSLMVYDSDRCRPFDTNRKGLNLGEGAAFLVLESEEKYLSRGRNPFARISGWANRNDAYHSTGTSPEGIGAQLAMRDALACAGLDSKDISYINAHGTGTENNDDSELAALKEVFGSDLPDFSSTKGATGHTLAASGSLEAVFSVLTLKHGHVFQNIGLRSPMLSSHALLQRGVEKDLSHVMSNSFGFGGNSTSLIFSKI